MKVEGSLVAKMKAIKGTVVFFITLSIVTSGRAGCICSAVYAPVCGSNGRTYSSECMLKCEMKYTPKLKKVSAGACPEKACACSDVSAPVCGSDGKTYPNEQCFSKCHKSKKPQLRIVHPGSCKGDVASNILPVPLPGCSCSMVWDPVCGSDNQTYSNEGCLSCAAQRKIGLVLMKHGECEADGKGEKTLDCVCPGVYSPVCGSDGKTYPSRCDLSCNSMTLQHDGVCIENSSTTRNRVTSPKAERICICTKLYHPLCGSDNKTYSNMCELNCKQRDNPDLVLKHPGKCVTSTCSCTREFSPVCGSDGKTYSNQGCMECANQDKSIPVTVARFGNCEDEGDYVSSGSAECECGAGGTPVCGTDGVTYESACDMNCKSNGRVKKFKSGACETKPKLPVAPPTAAKLERNPCICPKNYSPVCGSDGKTYGNGCMFKCAASKNPLLKQMQSGTCKPKVSESGSGELGCNCMDNEDPVCGSDGETYSNPCRLACAQKKKKHLKQERRGACESLASSGSKEEGCFCTHHWKPVCGSDGKTYGNECELICEKKKDNSLTKAHEGECGSGTSTSSNSSHPGPCTCPPDYEPVCADSAITYDNMCVFNCAKKFIQTLTMTDEGECEVCGCAIFWSPLCGSDNMTYSCECEFNCARRLNKGLTKKHDGVCEGKGRATPSCDCERHFQPFCGTDGKTYANECSMSCQNRHNHMVRKFHDGECGQGRRQANLRPSQSQHVAFDYGRAAEEDECLCHTKYDAVCGSDNITYPNECAFNCFKKLNPGLKLMKHGECSSYHSRRHKSRRH